MSSLASVTQTLACAVCRRLATVVYVRGFRHGLPERWWPCPHCWQDNRLTDAIKVLKVTDVSGTKSPRCAPPRKRRIAADLLADAAQIVNLRIRRQS